jgi:hypothetical protein
VKDSISALLSTNGFMDDFDCDACGCSAVEGGLEFSSRYANFVGLPYFHQVTSRDGILLNSLGSREF